MYFALRKDLSSYVSEKSLQYSILHVTRLVAWGLLLSPTRSK